jgi:Caspase domain
MIGTDHGAWITMRRSMIRAMLVLVLSILANVPALAASRVALVVGNGGYTHVESLRNPARDAADMAEKLGELGFDVVLGVDTDQRQFGELLAKTLERAKGANTVVFYYAGHGFEVSGVNRLVPIDAVLRDRAKIADETIDMNAIIEKLSGAGAQLVVLLDACRNSPLPAGVNLETGGAGLAKIETGRDIFVAFATESKQVAGDGKGRNSAFTKALLTHMDRPGLSIADMMVDVRRDVFASTKGKQLPWDQSSLKSAFYFVPNLLVADQPDNAGQDSAAPQSRSSGGVSGSDVIEPIEPGADSLIVGVEPGAPLQEGAEPPKDDTAATKHDDYRLLCAECKTKMASTVAKAKALANKNAASILCVFAATPNVKGRRQNLGFACGREREGRAKFAAMAQSACRSSADSGSDMVEGKYCKVISQQILKPAKRATKPPAQKKAVKPPTKAAAAQVKKPSSRRPPALVYGRKLWPQGVMSIGQVNRANTEYGKLTCRSVDLYDETRTCYWKQ